MKKIHLSAASGVLLCLFHGVAVGQGHDGPSFSGDVTGRYDDNVTRAESDADIEEDFVGSLLARVELVKKINATSGFIFSGSAEGEKYAEFEELDNINIKGTVSYKLHTGFGFFAPRLSFDASVNTRSYVNEQRSGNGYELATQLTRRMGESLTLNGGLRYRNFSADSEVFSVEDTSAFINADLLVSPRIALYSTFRFITGDVVSTAQPTLNIINASDAIEADEAFGGFATNRFVYRLEADTITVVLGGNYAFDSRSSVDASLLYIDTEAEGDIYYARTQYRISYLRRF